MHCPICDGVDYWPIPFAVDPNIERWRREAGYEAAYEWRLCRRCGNAFPSVQPDRRVLQRVWQAHRATLAEPVAEAEAWRERRRNAQIWATRSYRLLAPFAPRPGRFLDIACGLGETVRCFADHGWDAEGIDADPNVEALHRELGIRSRMHQFEELQLQGRYDLIQIAHAIYFMTHPMRFVGAVRDHLSSDGLFCVVISNFMSNVDPSLPGYAHTFFPTAASMRYALAAAGFETVISRTLGGSIYVLARPVEKRPEVMVHPRLILLGYRTKKIRYQLIGKPYLLLRRMAKKLYGLFRSS
jgi:SAM-dependent methyltransferase